MDYEDKIEKLEQKLDKLPDEITEKLKEVMDLKIINAMQKIKIDFYKWLVPIILGLLFSCVGVIFNFIR